MKLFGLFGKPKTEDNTERYERYEECQRSFTEAAQFTIDLTRDIAETIQQRMDDYIRQIEVTANVLTDALLILDSKGKVESFNHAAEMIFGWQSNEIIGKSITHLFVNHLGKPVKLTALMDSLRAENCYDLNDIQQGALETVMGVRKNKTTFYVDVTVSVLHRHNGTQDTILTVRDVTPYVNVQKELRESELHYKTIFDMSFDGICILNDFKIVEVNPSWCAIFRTKKEDAIGMDFRKFVDEDHVSKFSVCHERHMEGEDMVFEFELLVLDGTRVVVTCAPVATSAETFASIVTIRDVTCRRCCNPSY